MMRRAVLFFMVILSAPIFLIAVQAQFKGQFCGFALVEDIPDVEFQLPILSRLTPDEKPTSDPSQLFQYRVSLDGSKALIEGCWLIFPTRDLVVNWLSLSGRDEQKKTLDETLLYSLFAPDGTHEDSAASVRQFLSDHQKEWEPADE